MEIAGNTNAYGPGSEDACDARIEAVQMGELLHSGYSIVDYNLRAADNVFVTESDAGEYLSILESLLEAETQEERDKIVSFCAQGSYPELPEFVIAAIRCVDRSRARELIAAIHARMPELFDDVYFYLMTKSA